MDEVHDRILQNKNKLAMTQLTDMYMLPGLEDENIE